MGGGSSSSRLHSGSNNRDRRRQYTCDHHILNQMNFMEILGKGGFATVYVVKEMKDGNIYAVKRINLKNYLHHRGNISVHHLDPIFAELNIFKRIQSSYNPSHSSSPQFIVNLHSAFHNNGSCYFVMKCLDGGDLRNYIRIHGALSEKSAMYVVGCIGSALHYLHCQGIVHRDVKPENIALDLHGRPYLTDFGISVMSSEDNPLPICETSSGTLQYLAPEVLAPGNLHSYQSDYWSLGVVFYELLFARRPFPRHCPVEWIKFVSTEYGWLWNKIHEMPSHVVTALSFDELSPDSPSNSSLIVPIPESVATDISDESKKMLSGLLDVQIPSRLGSIAKFSLFSDHECFHINDWAPLTKLWSTESPLIVVPSTLSSIPPEWNINDGTGYFTSLSMEIRSRLDEFSYESPLRTARL